MRSLRAILTLALCAFTGGKPMEASADKTMDLCLVAPKFDVEPFKPIGDGNRHTLLNLILKDYISTDPGVPGLLDAFHFSADGVTFTGRVASDAKWRDGAPLTSREAALGIAKGLHFRPAGETIRVLGTDGINSAGWEQRSYAGVRIIDDRQFELTFDASPTVANRVGVVRELLSSGELANRLWPARLGGKSALPDDGLGDFVSPYSFRASGKEILLTVGKHVVRLHLDGACTNPDFTTSAAPHSYTSLDGYEVTKSGRDMALLAMFNSSRPGLTKKEERAQLGSWLRYVVDHANLESKGARLARAHFEKMESGYSANVQWNAQPELYFSRKAIRILAGNKSIPKIREGAAIEAAASAKGLKIEWVYRGTDPVEVDVVLHPGAVRGGRQVWLEAALTYPLLKDFVPRYPKTDKALAAIRERSASTIPVDAALLSAFEAATLEENSIVPISRYWGFSLSRKGLPVKYAFLESGRAFLSIREARE